MNKRCVGDFAEKFHEAFEKKNLQQKIATLKNSIKITPKESIVNVSPKPETREIAIGIDFGTSYTKVVFQDLALESAIAIDFGELGQPHNCYLIPSKIGISSDGVLSVSTGDFQNGLKLLLMEMPDRLLPKIGVTAEILVTGYLALILRYSLKWFTDNKKNIYAKQELVWQLNIGLPSRAEDKDLESTFRTVALAAWNLSCTIETISLQSAKKAHERALDLMTSSKSAIKLGNNEHHPDIVTAIPEIIAEVAGCYSRSTFRRDGLHMLIDIGASTIDASTFILGVIENTDRYVILTAEVDSLGTFNLHQRRIAQLKSHLKNKLDSKACEIDGVSTLNSLHDINQFIEVSTSDTERFVYDFKKECTTFISKIIHETRTKRCPKGNVWKDDFPVFLCGGGANLSIFSEILANSSSNLASTGFRGASAIELPKPENLEAPKLSTTQYNRLAVAYGLSLSALDTGEIVPPHKVDDIFPIQRESDLCQYFVTKEMV